MKTFKKKKQEAIASGIMPGASIRCAKDGEHGVVAPIEKWKYDMGDLVVGDDRRGNYLFGTYGRGFATVITPAPQTGGLEDGMVCEPDEHMRAVIIAKAKELGYGVCGAMEEDPSTWRILAWRREDTKDDLTGNSRMDDGDHAIPPGEFYDRLCRMPKAEPPIMIGPREVKFENGGDIVVGCTNVDFATLEKVYNKALSMR